MSKRLIATVLAASLALTSLSAAPARADSGELGRFLLGAGALFIIGSALSNQNRNRNIHNSARNPNPVYRDYPRRKLLPQACLRENRFNNGPRRFFGQRCLSRNWRYTSHLPGSCLRTVWGNHGRRQVYGAHCLRRHGYRFGT